MCTTVDTGEIIILSDDDDDDDDDDGHEEPSVLIVEVQDLKKNDVVLPQGPLDEDLVVTFSRRAEVLPHARYDCPIHPFMATDHEVSGPVASNQLICDQCFCYICDKLASLCVVWCQGGVCHCNSHKRSDFWNNIRNRALLGWLKTFNLSLSEVDHHLRLADTMLRSFRQELSQLFSSFLMGKMPQEYGLDLPNNQCVIYDYRPVYEFVSSFLDKADKQGGRAAAIMRLGAAEYFSQHFRLPGTLVAPMADVADAKVALLQRVVVSVQRQMVMGDLTSEFAQKLQAFYKTFNFHAELKSMRNSLCIRPWDDILLMSVLKGQNVSGVRKDKGKKDILIEQFAVILLRTELLQRQRRYRELHRYLRVVLVEGHKLGLQQLKDLIPFFKCMDRDLMSAVHSLFPSLNGPASRLTPSLFLVYLHIFETATAPNLTVSQPAQLCCSDATWEPIKDAVPLKRIELVKFALRAQRCCSAVVIDSRCWTRFLTIVNSPCGSLTALPAPHPQFLHEAKAVVNSILQNPDRLNIHLPRFFQDVYPDQALLLLVTGALGLRILSGPLCPALPVLNTYKGNVWALEWLWATLSSNAERLNGFMQELSSEMENTADGDKLPVLHTIVPTVFSSTQNWDQQSSDCETPLLPSGSLISESAVHLA